MKNHFIFWTDVVLYLSTSIKKIHPHRFSRQAFIMK